MLCAAGRLGRMGIVTLLTDFGSQDTYVGQVKGAILAIAPEAAVVDLTHAVPPQDVLAGAFLLWAAVDVFPPGSIHLAVVDPGVGSARRAIAVRSARGDVFVGPDNGLLVPAAERFGAIDGFALTERRYWAPQKSGTFDGRDVFGPVAGHLAAGVALEQLGQPVSELQRVAGLEWSRGPDGNVVHVDTYGNLITNILGSTLPARFRVRLGTRLVRQAGYYEAVQPGELLALVGSAGLVEISARNASAAAITGAARGTPVTVEELPTHEGPQNS
jgi:S-adenosyl-L-methionine hydrolase (adenosine-forming)